jgi:hypothetical protein
MRKSRSLFEMLKNENLQDLEGMSLEIQSTALTARQRNTL